MDSDITRRRRRGLAYVTSNACLECKKKKTKCDGKDPCARCTIQNNGNCCYETPIHTSKASLRDQIAELHTFREHSENLFESLASGENVEVILKDLQDGISLEDISNGLKKEGQSPDLPTWHFDNTSSSKTRGQEEQSFGTLDALSADLPQTAVTQIQIDNVVINDNHNGPIEPWTRITTNLDLIEHLMSLYFCWEYPVFASLSRPHFLSDFQAGNRRFCSPLLVNAMLAVGYQFSATSKRDRNGSPQKNEYLEEAERLLEVEKDKPALTTIQALGVMSIVQASQGGTEQSSFYCGQAIRMCVEMGLHLNIGSTHLPIAEQEVRRVTAWGAFALDHAWCLVQGSIPHLSREGFRSLQPTTFENEEAAEWVPYTGESKLENKSLRQSSNTGSIYRALCGLFATIHNSLYVLYAPGKSLTRASILDVYTTYLAWYSDLPDVVRQGQNSTPPVFFIHVYYNLAVLLLFGPLIKFQFTNSEIHPYTLCVQAADAINALNSAYAQLYGLQRTPCFMPIITLASSVMHAVQVNVENTLHVIPQSNLEGTIALQGMSYSHKFAGHAIKYINVVKSRSGRMLSFANSDYEGISGNHVKDKQTLFHWLGCAVSFVKSNLADLPPELCDPLLLSIFAPYPGQTLPLQANIERLTEDGLELIRPRS